MDHVSRRAFVGGLAAAGATGLLGLPPDRANAEPPPETTKLRLARTHSSPQKIIAQGTDWRFLNELKRELKG